jgi:Ser/Thr protein kinase RdoA (MazF antagonist)
MENLGPELTQYWDFDPNSFQLLAARENTIYCAKTAQGKIVIRKHRSGYQDAVGIESELSLMHAMKAADCRVPDAIATKDSRFVIKHNGDHFTAIRWVTGQTMFDVLSADPSPDRIAQIFHDLGVCLAQFHNATDAWTPTQNFHRHSWDREGLVGPRPLWGRFWDNPDLSPEERDIFIHMQNQMNDALMHLEGTLDYGVIHADLIPDNVMIDNNEITFLDFDDCGFGFRLFDLATILLKQIETHDFQDKAKALMEGYRTTRDLDPRFVLMFLVLRSLTYVGWIVDRPNIENAAARSRHFIERARLLSEQFIGTMTTEQGDLHV